MPTPSAAAKDTITETISSSGATSERSSTIRITNTTSSVSGMISLLSRVADTRRSYSCAVGPPTSVFAPPACLTDLAQLRDRVQRRRTRTGRPCRSTASWTPAAPSTGRADVRRRVALLLERACVTAAALAASRDDHVGRRGRAGGEVAREDLLALDGVDLAAELVAGRLARVEVERRWRRARSSTIVPTIQIVRGRVATRSPTRRQKPCVSSTPGLAGVRDRVQARRPERAAAADRQQRREDVSIEIIASATPIAPTGPSPAVELTSAMLSVSSAAITVRPEARIAGPALRSAIAHRLVLVLVASQLLAVAGHEQQRVVRAGAEDEHGQDAAGLAVDRHARLGQQIAGAARRALGEQHAEERDRPEDRRAVDDDQQDSTITAAA